LIVINRINADIDGNEGNETYERAGDFHSVLRRNGRATENPFEVTTCLSSLPCGEKLVSGIIVLKGASYFDGTRNCVRDLGPALGLGEK
jgi:hypothetical protein